MPYLLLISLFSNILSIPTQVCQNLFSILFQFLLIFIWILRFTIVILCRQNKNNPQSIEPLFLINQLFKNFYSINSTINGKNKEFLQLARSAPAFSRLVRKKKETSQTKSRQPAKQSVMENNNETTIPVETAATDSSTNTQSPEIAAMIEEAEQRGYQRAKLEMAEQKFNAPNPDEEPAPVVIFPALGNSSDFLSRQTKSVWDL